MYASQLWQPGHDHVFFNCKLSSKVWNDLLDKGEMHWDKRQRMEWICFLSTNVKGKSTFAKLIRLLFTNCVYSLWQKRNNRIHQDVKLFDSIWWLTLWWTVC